MEDTQLRFATDRCAPSRVAAHRGAGRNSSGTAGTPAIQPLRRDPNDMTVDSQEKRSQRVPAFTVKVLGGRFRVSSILLQAQEAPERVLAVLQETEADRWFVMVSDNGGEGQDSLAMIDDSLEFQIYAQGVLSQD